jgi:hypothetical protein
MLGVFNYHRLTLSISYNVINPLCGHLNLPYGYEEQDLLQTPVSKIVLLYIDNKHVLDTS